MQTIEFHDTTVRVRYAETDQMGVVYHANYLIWFEVGRVELMRAMGFEYKTMETEDDCHIVVAEAHCRYEKSARYDEVLRIRTRVTELRTSEEEVDLFKDAEIEEFFAEKTRRAMRAFSSVETLHRVGVNSRVDAKLARKAIQFAIANATGKDKNTIGGPIDVAILRKNGTIEWVSRKRACYTLDEAAARR